MKRALQGTGTLLAAVAIMMLPACESAKDLQISELQQQTDDLRAQNEDIQSRLAAALNAGDRASQLALSLQRQLDEARSQLAAGLAESGEAPAGWTNVGNITWTDVGTDFLFDSGKAKLKEEALEKVRELAETIKSEFAGHQIWVIGHTDTDPIKVTKNLWTDNLDLSLNRAATVAREFYQLGVDQQSLYVAGQGEFRPKAPNDTKANKMLNRRVEIIAVATQGD